MNEFIVWAIIFAILGSAVGYIVVQKKKGVKCVGCASETPCACLQEKEHSCACQTNTSQASSCCGKHTVPLS